jgi:hypothetical protein
MMAKWCRQKHWLGLSACLLLAANPATASEPFEVSAASGLDLMEKVYKRHRQYPYVYEEHSMVLIDRDGHRRTRKAKVYFRVEEDLRQRMLLMFETPEDVKGVAVLAERDSEGVAKQAIYLPSLGDNLIENSGEAGDANFLGTDFSVENLTGEELSNYQYRRQRDVMINDKMYCVVDVYQKESTENALPIRRHFVSQDNLYITRTDYYDDQGRVRKRQSHHDLTQVLGDMWRANMLLMENFHDEHQTLIKIDRRVFSQDYVPTEVFTTEYLFANGRALQPVLDIPDAEAEAELTGGAGQ